MRSCSGTTPRFSGLTIVCTALSEQANEGLVHRVVTHTTHPVALEVRYVLRLKAGAGGSSKAKA
ncbi:MAG: hypothetical protein IPF78_12550 [Flavobacteriales bacterium]|nr:hypothetical protein [Flavobacteriales bacterium]